MAKNNQDSFEFEEELFNEPVPENLTLLNAFEWMYYASSYTHLSDTFFAEAERATSFINGRLGVTPLQAALLSVALAQCAVNNCFDTKDLTVHFCCTPYQSIAINQELTKLRKMHMLCTISGRNTGLTVTKELMDAVQEDKPMPVRETSDLSFEELFIELRNIIQNAREESDITELADICKEIRELFAQNMNIKLCRDAEKVAGGSSVSFFTFIYFCCHLVNMDQEYVSLHKSLLPTILSEREYSNLTCSLKNGTNPLVKNEAIEAYTVSGMYEDTYRLTDKVKKGLMSEYMPVMVKNTALTDPSSIVVKDLFYNPDIQKQMDAIERLLDPVNYQTAVARLEKAGLRRGVAVLLSGPCGTGKTEFVLQLARKTGRPIMQVNVSDIKDKFVGESEKRCASMWSSYNKLVEESEVTPILFLNEADQILGKRFENVKGSADQSSNSLQNIMLENMEKTDGIMICTTNLAQNLDSAFERRFLFKVQLDRPAVQARRAIWRSLVPEISEECAEKLAEKYDLSGGQVENISRKLLISSALSGECEIGFDRYCEFCEEELGKKRQQSVAHIGF